MTDTTNKELLEAIRNMAEEQKKNPLTTSIEKIILGLVSIALVGMFGFVLDMNVRVSLIEQKQDNDVLRASNVTLAAKVETLEKDLISLQFKLKAIEEKADE